MQPGWESLTELSTLILQVKYCVLGMDFKPAAFSPAKSFLDPWKPQQINSLYEKENTQSVPWVGRLDVLQGSVNKDLAHAKHGTKLSWNIQDL